MTLEEFLENVRVAIVDHYHAGKYASVEESDYKKYESTSNKLEELIGSECYYVLSDQLNLLKIADDIKIGFMLMGPKVDIHATVYDETTVVDHVKNPWYNNESIEE